MYGDSADSTIHQLEEEIEFLSHQLKEKQELLISLKQKKQNNVYSLFLLSKGFALEHFI